MGTVSGLGGASSSGDGPLEPIGGPNKKLEDQTDNIGQEKIFYKAGAHTLIYH